jgi:hypothetical protein
VPLDQDVNEAISRLHFGTTLPFWDAAVVVQARRLAPIEEWVVQRIAAMRRCDEGLGTADDITAKKELVDLLDQRWEAGEGRFPYSTQDQVDSIFLLLAIRSILTMADRIVSQLKPLGKEAEASRARNAFTSKFAVIKTLRNVTLHHDEYAIGDGQHKNLIIGPNEGLGVMWDQDGYIYIAWAGHQVRVLEAASAALDLSRALTDMFWGEARRP